MDDLGFSVEFFDKNGVTWLPPAGLTFEPQSWSAMATGGPDDAKIKVKGQAFSLWELLRILAYEVRIRGATGRLLWWGYVHEVTATVGGTTVGLTLETMYNAVRILYSYEDEDGAPQDAETAVSSNSDSMTRYGRKEMLYSAGDADATSAEKLRDKFKAIHEWPTVIAESGDSDDDEATIECRGWWHALEWEYYADPTGREIFDTQNGQQVVGWELSSDAVAFTQSDKTIYHNGVAFRALNVDDKITISGSTSNDGTYTIEDSADRNGQRSYTATTIRFQADEEIFDDADDASGLGFVDKNDFILISGTTSGSNDRYWRLNDAAADHLVIQKWWSYNIATQSAGPSVTITRLLKLRVTEALNNGYPGPTVTITVPGEKVYQKWTPTSGTWDAATIAIRCWKEGTPSDNLKVELCANSGGYPGTVLADATVAGSAIAKQATWKEFTLSTTVEVATGTNYHIVVSRTGASDDEHFYYVAVDEDLGYSGGTFQLWDGSSWINRTTDADMCFQVWGTRENATQMYDMLSSHLLVARAEVATTSIATRHYRDGRSTVREEVERLFDQGTSVGGHLVANVTPQRTFQIAAEPTSSNTGDYLIDGGRLLFADGTPCEPGFVPAGNWARIRGLPSSESYARISPMFLQRVEYSVKQGAWRWEPRGMPDVFAEWGLRQG